MTAPLRDRTAAVTGASRGIGLAIARRLGAEGARVAVLSRDRESVARAARTVGRDALAVVCDVRDPGAVARALDAISTQFGDVPDAIVCAAGTFTLARVRDADPNAFADAIAVNLFGPFLIVRAVLPRMLERGSGHCVLIGSVADRHAYPENGAYAASKFGARGLWEVLRAELRGSGVRATLVSPGPTDTPLWDAHDPDAREGFVPRASMLRPDAVADAVAYALTRPPGVLIEELRLSSA
ncbi:MAG TPA: SDR family oxidoreductase [Gemmatimonadaceae bacterium]|nr:SDR family oxidoreductase [Gemmatimonadaceae bacterium]